MFDLLEDERGNTLLDTPLAARRPKLETFASKNFRGDGVRLSPATTKLAEAKGWLRQVGATLDGIIAKRRDAPYAAGTRDAMVKVKNYRSADCVVGGFRYGTNSKLVGSLLLGLYDDAGLLHHVGFTSSIARAEKAALTAKLEKLKGGPGFTGNAPGGPSRWSTERSAEWVPLKPKLVVEVCYDHFSGERFRHGTRLMRWRPDKAPRAMHDGSGEAEEGGFDEVAAEVAHPEEPAQRVVSQDGATGSRYRHAAIVLTETPPSRRRRRMQVRPAPSRSPPAPRRRDRASR